MYAVIAEAKLWQMEIWWAKLVIYDSLWTNLVSILYLVIWTLYLFTHSIERRRDSREGGFYAIAMKVKSQQHIVIRHAVFQLPLKHLRRCSTGMDTADVLVWTETSLKNSGTGKKLNAFSVGNPVTMLHTHFCLINFD